jgi:hypothetical protein
MIFLDPSKELTPSTVNTRFLEPPSAQSHIRSNARPEPTKVGNFEKSRHQANLTKPSFRGSLPRRHDFLAPAKEITPLQEPTPKIFRFAMLPSSPMAGIVSVTALDSDTKVYTELDNRRTRQRSSARLPQAASDTRGTEWLSRAKSARRAKPLLSYDSRDMYKSSGDSGKQSREIPFLTLQPPLPPL